MSEIQCKLCGGTGTIDKDNKSYECECSLWKRIATSMPSYILNATFSAQHLQSPLLGSVNRSCFVSSAWIDMRAIIKAVMMKHYTKYVRITSDRELRDVYVGSKSRANLEEDAKVVYNSVEDLMGGGDPKGRGPGGPDLVVLRLNELGYKNKAAAGILEEAIMCRLDYGRPTWVVSDLDRPFGTGSYAYSETVWDLLQSSFVSVRIPRITPRMEPSMDDGPNHQSVTPRLVVDDLIEPVVNKPNKIIPESHSEKPKRVIQSIPDDDASPSGIGLYGSGVKKSKFGPKKPFGRND